MANIYLDTGALVKLYVVESGSEAVQATAQSAARLTLNPLQETELRNAILAAVGRGRFSAQAGRATLGNFDADIQAGVFWRESPDWSRLWTRANQLAAAHTPHFLCRTLDILHVAAAELISADEFVTGDTRQARLAEAIGLRTTLFDSSAKK